MLSIRYSPLSCSCSRTLDVIPLILLTCMLLFMKSICLLCIGIIGLHLDLELYQMAVTGLTGLCLLMIILLSFPMTFHSSSDRVLNSVLLENSAVLTLVLTDVGSPRFGVREHVEFRYRSSAVTINDFSRYKSESATHVLGN